MASKRASLAAQKGCLLFLSFFKNEQENKSSGKRICVVLGVLLLEV